MKKWTALVLCLTLICSCFSAVLAESGGTAASAGYDLSTILENTSMFTVDVDEEQNVAFVESNISVSMKAFTHQYESEKRYSYPHFDILVVNYGTEAAYPVLRLWTTYCADQFLNISSITFTVGGKDYTFTEVADEGRKVSDEDGAKENLLIRFGDGNLEFLVALENSLNGYEELTDLLDETKAPQLKVVLHGDEDVEVTLGGVFLVDFLFICEKGFADTNGFNYLSNVQGTPVTITDAE